MNVPYPQIDPGTPKMQKVRLLSDQVSAFMDQGKEFGPAMSAVLYDRYSGIHKELYRDVASNEAMRSVRKRAHIARQNRMAKGQLFLQLV